MWVLNKSGYPNSGTRVVFVLVFVAHFCCGCVFFGGGRLGELVNWRVSPRARGKKQRAPAPAAKQPMRPPTRSKNRKARRSRGKKHPPPPPVLLSPRPPRLFVLQGPPIRPPRSLNRVSCEHCVRKWRAGAAPSPTPQSIPKNQYTENPCSRNPSPKGHREHHEHYRGC